MRWEEEGPHHELRPFAAPRVTSPGPGFDRLRAVRGSGGRTPSYRLGRDACVEFLQGG